MSRTQFLRFVVVGAASNGVLYILYILATSLGIGHKLAMSTLYFVGVLQTFVANRSWSFGYRGRKHGALVRYLIAYLLAYLLNLGTMYTLVDVLGYSDRLVQGCMVVVVALLLFLAQKFWIFPEEKKHLKTESV